METPRYKQRKRRPPNLFGAYDKMNILIALAQAGPVRRIALAEKYSDLRYLLVSDRAGLVVRWEINHNGTYAFGLNPDFRLARELQRLLEKLGVTFPQGIKSDLRPEEREIPVNALGPREVSLDHLFGSSTRSRLFVTLEALGGTVPSANLNSCVPGEYTASVKNAVRAAVKEGILRNQGGAVTFASCPWTKELRLLLRAFGACQPGLLAQIEDLREKLRSTRIHAPEMSLIGTKAIQRLLCSLAVNGPTRHARLFAAASTVSERALRTYEKMGIVVSQWSGRNHLLSLNASHPVYPQLRRLLVAMAGTSPRSSRPHDLKDPRTKSSIDSVFGSYARTHVLIAVFASKGEIECISIARLYPQLDRHNVSRALRRFKELGILTSRKWKHMEFYSLDPSYAYVAELRSLLRGISAAWPQFLTTASVVKELYPPNRKAMHRTSTRSVRRSRTT